MSSSSDVAPLINVLASAPTTGTIRATLPWQQSYTLEATSASSTFIVRTFTLDEIPGLVQQCRGSLVQRVHNVKALIRKIPGLDVSYYCFVGSVGDFEDVNSIGDMVEYIETYPTARAEFTLSAATTDNRIELPLIWPIGVGSSVTCTLPPARPPVIVLYISASGGINKKSILQLTGEVDIEGIGHVAGTVAAAKSAP